jgi:glucose-6-phosphate 1-dehydrogenase
MIIFGGGGDLAARKLLPALYMAHLHGNLPADTRIIAVGRRDWTIDDYRQFMDEQSRRSSTPRPSTRGLGPFLTCSST